MGVDGSVFIYDFTCSECGKSHFCAGIGPNSECACGAPLYRQMWDRAFKRATTPPTDTASAAGGGE